MGMSPEGKGGTAMERLRALSITQPYAEQILRGTKKIEYRTVRTNIRGEFAIYASLTPGPLKEFEKLGLLPGDLPTGVIVGTAEIVNCAGAPGACEWHLRNPVRREARQASAAGVVQSGLGKRLLWGCGCYRADQLGSSRPALDDRVGLGHA